MKYRTTIQSLLWLLLIVSFAMTSGCASLDSDDPYLRAKAVKKLTDQTVLAKVAMEDEHDWVRRTAVEKLTDPLLLARIAVEDEDYLVRGTAVGNQNLTDQSLLAEIAGKDSHPETCYKAINKVFDSSLLDTCKHRQYGNIRRFAQLRLILRDPVIVKHTGRIEAYIIYTSTSESYTFDIVNSTSIYGERLEVYIENMTDRSVILREHLITDFPKVTRSRQRISAYFDFDRILGELLENCNVTDSGLADIAINAKGRAVPRAAVEKLTDQPLLRKIAVEHEDDGVRRTAVKKLTDQPLLGKIAVEDEDGGVRRTALEKLTDQPLLEKIAVEHEDYWIRTAAVKKLTDQALLAKIAVEDEDERVRKAAKLRLSVIQGLAVD